MSGAQPIAKVDELHLTPLELIARIYEVFPLLCPKCGGQMRLIAFITEGTQIRRVLDHIGVEQRNRPPTTRSISASIGERAGLGVLPKR